MSETKPAADGQMMDIVNPSETPHGGFKHSDYSKDISMYGLEDYTRIKHVVQYHGFEG